MELNQDEFITAINIGQEIEICFRGKWYFFRRDRAIKKTEYLFCEMGNSQLNEIMSFDSIPELLNMRIQDALLTTVLCNLDDYTIY